MRCVDERIEGNKIIKKKKKKEDGGVVAQGLHSIIAFRYREVCTHEKINNKQK